MTEQTHTHTQESDPLTLEHYPIRSTLQGKTKQDSNSSSSQNYATLLAGCNSIRQRVTFNEPAHKHTLTLSLSRGHCDSTHWNLQIKGEREEEKEWTHFYIRGCIFFRSTHKLRKTGPCEISFEPSPSSSLCFLLYCWRGGLAGYRGW